MWASRVGMLVAAGVLLSGCSSMRGRSDVARLQSQLGLLDERITQLERTSVAGASISAEPPMPAPPADSGMSFGETRSSSSSSKRISSSGGGAVSASLKPSTREIQQALKNAGFYQGTVDGRSGPVTKDAVKEFQRVHGLTDDGVVGRQTWLKLKAYSSLSSDGSDEATAGEALK